jgi:NAD(P)-dependent dehydrogenase (short-subunit alcohol dehydrogenase family)
VARLDGKVAVITGGASGMGEGTVRRFVAEGARVVIADLQDAKGHTLADSLGGAAVFQHTDVATEPDIEAAVGRAVDEFGRLDCIFNNAGVGGVITPIDETPLDGYNATIGILLTGVMLGMKHGARAMKRQGDGGSIISTASVAGLSGGRGPHIYSAAKAAVVNLTRSVALELAEHNIRVNCICPGAIATPLLARVAGNADEPMEELRRLLPNFQPLRRAGLPEDIAAAALWLASDEARFVTGQALVIDGGLTAGPMSFFERMRAAQQGEA